MRLAQSGQWLIQHHGGRTVIAGAMALMATGLTVLALAPNLPVYLLGWGLLGAGDGGGPV